MATNLGDRLGAQVAAEEQGITARRDAAGKLTVLNWVNAASTLGEIAKALPAGLDAARFMRQVQTELRKNPGLLEADPRSFILGVLYFAQLGLELGPLGLAYLTGPFTMNAKGGIKEVVPVIGYKGLAQLAYRSDKVELVDAVSVHEGEPFKITRGTNPSIEHEELPEFAGASVVAYYAIAVIRGATRVPFDVMWPADIEAIQKRSPSARASISPWKSDYEAMAKKTVMRRLLNRGKVPLETNIAHAIAEDELRELGLDKPLMLDPAIMPFPEQSTDTAPETTQQPSASSDPGAAFRQKPRS